MLQVASYENSKMEIHIVSDFSEAYLGESAVITTFKLYLGFYTFTSWTEILINLILSEHFCMMMLPWRGVTVVALTWLFLGWFLLWILMGLGTEGRAAAVLFVRCRIGFGHGSSSGGGGISKEQTCHGYQLINAFGSFLVVMALLLDVTFSRLLDLDALLSMAPLMSMLTRGISRFFERG